MTDKFSQLGGCFVAGTMVRTKEGFKPIEDIQIGDRVLAQPEETGQRAYKRVVRTLQFEDKEVWSVEIFPKSELDQARREDRMLTDGISSRLVVTANHPFWVVGLGWTRADSLDSCRGLGGDYAQLQLPDGELALVSTVAQIRRTADAGIGWIQDLGNSDSGERIDLRKGAISAEFDFRAADMTNLRHHNEGVAWWNPENAYRCAVYNFEVEDFHTYYVGSLGVWVHR